MGVLAFDWTLAAQCEQPCTQASADRITGYGFAKAAGDDPQHVRRVGREHRERRANVEDQHDLRSDRENGPAKADEGQIEHFKHFGRRGSEFKCAIDPGSSTLYVSHFIYLSIMYGFIVI